MELVEVIVEGLRGFPRQTRLTFGPALSVVSPIDGRHTIISRAILDVLYPEQDPPLLAPLIDETASASRVAATLVGRDQQTYRILRDLRSGRVSLLRKGQGGFEPIADRAQQVAQAVTAQLGFPQYDVFRELLTTRASDVPSRRSDEFEEATSSAASEEDAPLSGGGAADWDKPLPPGFSDPGAADSYAHLSDDDLKKQIAELDTRIASFDRVAETEFEVDGLRKKVYEIDEKLRPVDHLVLQLEYAQEEASRFGDLQKVPPDMPVRYEELKTERATFKTRQEERDARKNKLEARLKREVANAKTPKQIIRAAAGDPYVRYGLLGAGAAILIGCVGFFSAEGLKYVAYLDVVGALVASIGAWRLIGDAEEGVRLTLQLGRVDAIEKKERDRLGLEETAFRALLKRAEIDEEDIAPIIGQLGQYREAKHAEASARAAVEEALPADERNRLEGERQRLKDEAKALEEKLYAMGAGVVGGKAALLQKRDALAAALRKDTAAPPKVVEPDPKPAADISAEGERKISPHVVEALIDHASDMFVSDTDGATSRIGPRASQILGFLSDGRFSQVQFTGTGAPMVVDAASGQQVDYAALPPGDRDTVYFTLKIAILEAAVAGGRLPIVFEQAFEPFPSQKGGAVGKLVAYMARLTQVILLTTRTDLGELGGHQVALPPAH